MSQTCEIPCSILSLWHLLDPFWKIQFSHLPWCEASQSPYRGTGSTWTCWSSFLVVLSLYQCGAYLSLFAVIVCVVCHCLYDLWSSMETHPSGGLQIHFWSRFDCILKSHFLKCSICSNSSYELIFPLREQLKHLLTLFQWTCWFQESFAFPNATITEVWKSCVALLPEGQWNQ